MGLSAGCELPAGRLAADAAAGRPGTSSALRQGARWPMVQHRLRRVVQPGARSRTSEALAETIARPRRERAWSTRRTAPSGSHRRLRRPARSGCCASPTATTPTWPATSPTTATSSSCGASTRSSTSGAPTTRARCQPAGRRRGPGRRPRTSSRCALGQMVSHRRQAASAKRLGNAVDLDDLVERRRRPTSCGSSRCCTSVDQPPDHRPRRRARRRPVNPRSSTCSTPTPASRSIGRVGRGAGVEPGAARRRRPRPAHARAGAGARLRVARPSCPRWSSWPSTSGRPTRSPTWVRELADRFHGFYHDCYVMAQSVARRAHPGPAVAGRGRRSRPRHRPRPARRVGAGARRDGGLAAGS